MCRIQASLLAALVAAALPATASNKIAVANEGAIGDKWTPVQETLAKPNYPVAYAEAQEQVCVAVGYLVNGDGHTSNFALLKSWNSSGPSRDSGKLWSAFAGSAAQAVAQWRFAPNAGVASPDPVYTVTTFVFGPGDPVATRSHCAIAGVAARLIELGRNDRSSRLMAGGIFSKLDLVHDRTSRIWNRENPGQERANRQAEARGLEDGMTASMRSSPDRAR